jgi:glyoxylase-like metal-dependent hydrolase (beta-lactamase superfamily II)
VRLIDVRHLGRERVIGTWLVDGCLVDPGPASSLPAVLDALDGERPERLLLTHIHLDHAGGAGTLVRRWPELEVWVHERGAPHLAAPDRLLASAARLYGDDMERLWGEVLPVPRDRLRVLAGGEAEGPWRVAYTPGHASHHVSYLHAPSATAFVGDAGGVRIPPAGPALPPTPPPDIDVRAWRASLERIAAWRPSRLALTHFGAWEDVDAQLDAVRAGLERFEDRARRLDEAGFVGALREEIAAATDAATAAVYEQAMPARQLWLGMERCVRRS